MVLYFKENLLDTTNSTGKDLPISQLYPPANILGICHGHDYLQRTPEDKFLKDMSISEISLKDQQAIEAATRQQQKNKQWKEERKKRLQSSNFGRICQMSGY